MTEDQLEQEALSWGENLERNLMTLHSSEELRFQAIITIELEKGVFPSGLDRTEEQLKEA